MKIRRFAYLLSQAQKGLLQMCMACLLFSWMNACVFAIGLVDADLPASVISFFRVLCNLLILLLPALCRRRFKILLGDGRPSLWLRGLFGASALMLSFAAITRIGPGESALLTASSGVFVALLGPWVLGQRNSWQGWLAIAGSLVGILLLFNPQTGGSDFSGRAMALASGFLSALAYLMVARAGRSNSPQTVIFYFCLLAVLLHGVYFSCYGYQLPKRAETWALLSLIGVLGSSAQFYMTRAYQTAPAALVSAVGYLVPVLSLVWGVCWFSQIPSPTALLGALLIVCFGVGLPFLRRESASPAR